MQKVLHFIDSGGVYGAESVILNLSREMLKHSAFQPVVGCIVQHADEPVELYDMASGMGIEAVKIVVHNAWFPIDVIRAAYVLKKMGIRLIHSHGYKPSVVGFVVHLLASIEFTATCHLWYMGGERPLKQKIMTWVEQYFYRFCRHVVGVSQPIKKFLVSAGVPESRIHVIKNGIFVDDYAEKFSREELARYRKELRVKGNDFVLVNIARLTEQKAQHALIEAARKLKTRQIPVVFLIVGDGELRVDLEEAIARYDLHGQVRLLGFRKDVKALLSAADAFVLPSLDEGLPISLLEAMAGKLPVLVTPVGDIPDIARQLDTALVVPVNDVDALVDGILWLKDHPQERDQMAEKAFQVIQKNYSSTAMWAAYEKIYTDLSA